MNLTTDDAGGDAIPSSRWADIAGPIHYLKYDGPDDGPLIVLLHGLGGSSQSWAAVAPSLSRVARVIALDLPGCGLSPGSPRSVTLVAHQALLHSFMQEITGMPAILAGHSMGATIATMQAVRHPETTAGLVLIDPALPWQIERQLRPKLAGLAQALRTGMPIQAGRQWMQPIEQMLRDTIRAGYEQASQIAARGAEENLSALWTRIEDRQVNADMMAAARSLTLTVARRRQFEAMLQKVRVAVLMLHGDRDRFVPIGAAEAAAAANPAWRFEIARDIGHWPHIEAPEWTVERIVAWLGSEGSEAVEQARTAGRSLHPGDASAVMWTKSLRKGARRRLGRKILG